MSRKRRCGCNGPGNKITETIMNSASIVHFAYILIVLDEEEQYTYHNLELPVYVTARRRITRLRGACLQLFVSHVK